MRHNEPNPVRLTTGHKDTPPIWMDRTLRLYGLLKNFSEITTTFTRLHHPHTHSRDFSTSNEAQRTQPVHLTTGHKDTPPIWMDRTLRLYSLIKEISWKLQLFSQDSTAPTRTLETPRLPMRHNEPNPVRLITGHKDTPPIWMDRTLRLYGLIKNFSEITTLFTGLHRPHTHSQDFSTSSEAQRTQPSPFDHRSQGHTYMDGQDSTSLWLC